MSKYYLVFDIGCLECGEESQPVGLYRTEEEAQAVVETYPLAYRRLHGSHSVRIYVVETPSDTSI